MAGAHKAILATRCYGTSQSSHLQVVIKVRYHHAPTTNQRLLANMRHLQTGILILLLAVTRIALATTQTSWNYTDQDAWEDESYWYCDGTSQSPINIDTSDLFTNGSLISLTLTNFDQNFTGDFENTGHSVQFTPDSSLDTATIENYFGTYELQQFHFHWGSSSSEGSEHTIDGTSYAGELHFVTRKTTGNATDYDAYTVMAVLLVSDSLLSLSDSWEELYYNIPTDYGDTNTVSGLELTDFLPSSLGYYHYEGSLTTPACSEVVQWFVLKNTVNVPSNFLDALRTTVNDEDGETLTENHRDTQNLNDREVMVQDSSGIDSTSSRLSGILLMLMASFVTVLHY